MSFPTKIVYPLPPPTTNCLTSVQRAQLIRSTKKLGQILGTTPQLIDTSATHLSGPLLIDLPFNDIDDGTFSDASHESVSSCSSTISMAHSHNSLSRSGSTRSTSTRSRFLRRSRTSTDFDSSSDSWSSHKPPMLRLTTSLPLEMAPASPLTGSPSVYSHSPSSSIDENDHQTFTIHPHAHPSPHDSPTTPSFAITSTSSHRRNKMDRLRRKLGDDVPIDLVFPSEAEVTDAPSPVVEEKPLPVLPVVLGSRKASRSPRISSARDSISLDLPRPARRKAVPSEAPRLPPLPPNADEAWSPEMQHVKGTHRGSASLSMPSANVKLCVIVESPGEHGLGCSEGFGVSKNPTVLQSEWCMSDDEAAMVKSWSTRRGYDGWSERLNGTAAKRPSSYRKRPMTP